MAHHEPIHRRNLAADYSDLLFVVGTNSPGPHHVGIYAGGGQMVEAPYTGSHVRISKAGRSDYVGAVRFP